MFLVRRKSKSITLSFVRSDNECYSNVEAAIYLAAALHHQNLNMSVLQVHSIRTKDDKRLANVIHYLEWN